MKIAKKIVILLLAFCILLSIFIGCEWKNDAVSDLNTVNINAYTITAQNVTDTTRGHLYVKVNGTVILTFTIEVAP